MDHSFLKFDAFSNHLKHFLFSLQYPTPKIINYSFFIWVKMKKKFYHQWFFVTPHKVVEFGRISSQRTQKRAASACASRNFARASSPWRSCAAANAPAAPFGAFCAPTKGCWASVKIENFRNFDKISKRLSNYFKKNCFKKIYCIILLNFPTLAI